jgi:hypothetical protein
MEPAHFYGENTLYRAKRTLLQPSLSTPHWYFYEQPDASKPLPNSSEQYFMTFVLIYGGVSSTLPKQAVN